VVLSWGLILVLQCDGFHAIKVVNQIDRIVNPVYNRVIKKEQRTKTRKAKTMKTITAKQIAFINNLVRETRAYDGGDGMVTLDGLRAQIIEEWAKYGTSDNIDFEDQVHAVFPSELDDDEELPQVRPLTPQLLIELAAWALSENTKNIKLETVDARTVADVAEIVAKETGCTVESAQRIITNLIGIHQADGSITIDSEAIRPAEALMLKAEAALIASQSQQDKGILKDLSVADQAYEEAKGLADAARAHRDALIVKALQQGVRVGQVVQATSLSRQMVYRIAGK
jgi:hypothetical protein